MKNQLALVLLSSFVLAACGGSGEGGEDPSGFFNAPVEEQPESESTNNKPTVIGYPLGEVNLQFKTEIDFELSVNDPDGDEVSIEIANAPYWVVFDPEKLTVKITANGVGTFEDIHFILNDGKDTVESDSFSLLVDAPTNIEIDMPIPAYASEGDTLSLVIDGQPYETEINSQGDASLTLPIALDATENDILFVWQKSGYAPFTRILPSYNKTVIEQLDEVYSISQDVLRSWLPDASSTAYFKMIEMKIGEEFVISREKREQVVQSIDASSLLELSGYYHLAHTNGLLYGLNDILIDTSEHTGYSKKGLPEAFVGQIEEKRKELYVSNQVWNDVLNEAISFQSFISVDIDEDSSWVISTPVQANYGSGSGEVINYQADSKYTVLGDRYSAIGKVLSETGNLKKESDSLFIMSSEEGDNEPQEVSIDTRRDIVHLRTKLMELGLPFDVSDRWAVDAVEKEINPLVLSTTSVQGSRLSAVAKDPMGFYPSTLDSVTSVENAYTKEVEYAVNSSMDVLYYNAEGLSDVVLLKRVSQDTHDIILPLPDALSDGEITSFNWLDVYDSTFARTRGEDEVTYWNWSFDDSLGEFVFKNTESQDEYEYVVKVVDSGKNNENNEGSVNGVVFGATTQLYKNGDLIHKGITHLSVQLKALCEVDERCSFESLVDTNLVWFNTFLGEREIEGLDETEEGFIFAKDESGSPHLFDIHVSTDANCIVPGEECYIFGAYREPVVAKTESADEWLIGSSTWWPISVNANEINVLIEGQLVNFKALPIDSFGDRWGNTQK